MVSLYGSKEANHKVFCILKENLKKQNTSRKVFQMKYKMLFTERPLNAKYKIGIWLLYLDFE